MDTDDSDLPAGKDGVVEAIDDVSVALRKMSATKRTCFPSWAEYVTTRMWAHHCRNHLAEQVSLELSYS
jgi:hypothetical protein